MNRDRIIVMKLEQQQEQSNSVKQIKFLDTDKPRMNQEHKKNQNDGFPPPTFLQVQRVIKEFKRLYPTKNLQNIIENLHKNMRSSPQGKIFKNLKEIFLHQKPKFSYPFKIKNEDQICQIKKEVWTKQMIFSLAGVYVQNPSELSKIEENLKLIFRCSNQLLISRNIKYQLQQIFKKSLDKIRSQQELPQCISQGFKFRRLERMSEQNQKSIFSSPEAESVRVKLCEFYRLNIFDMNILISTILSVNEYVNWMNNLILRKNLQQTLANNSINREQYEFAGKRRKVLRLKQQKKPRKPPSYL